VVVWPKRARLSTPTIQDLAELTDRQQRQREFNKILPETTEYPAFLSAVQGVANVSGSICRRGRPWRKSSAQFYSKVPMKLKLVGKFHQIAKFFYGIGQLDRIINIEDISMKEPKYDGDEVTVRIECLATAFRSLSATKPQAVQGQLLPLAAEPLHRPHPGHQEVSECARFAGSLPCCSRSSSQDAAVMWSPACPQRRCASPPTAWRQRCAFRCRRRCRWRKKVRVPGAGLR